MQRKKEIKRIIKYLSQIVLFVSFPGITHANVIITEIMYDVDGTDTGREWIEVQNTGPLPIDLATYKLFEANANHKITAIGPSELLAGGFAIIADVSDKFKIDNPSYSGLLFDSTFSLSNNGETIGIRDGALVDNDSVSYSPDLGAGGDGNSLQKSPAGIWISNTPTIGTLTTVTESTIEPADNSVDENTTTDSLNSISDNSTHSSQETINVSYSPPELEVDSGRPRIGFVGSPLVFQTKVKKAKNLNIGSNIRSSWSMGDGALVFGDVITHTYQYPGNYIVIVNSDSNGTHAVSKVKVKVLEPKIKISTSDFMSGENDYIKITNLDKGELNIGNFIIEGSGKRFVIPEDTIIGAFSAVIFSKFITKIDGLKGLLKVINPSGSMVASIFIPDKSEPVFVVPDSFINFFKK